MPGASGRRKVRNHCGRIGLETDSEAAAAAASGGREGGRTRSWGREMLVDGIGRWIDSVHSHRTGFGPAAAIIGRSGEKEREEPSERERGAIREREREREREKTSDLPRSRPSGAIIGGVSTTVPSPCREAVNPVRVWKTKPGGLSSHVSARYVTVTYLTQL